MHVFSFDGPTHPESNLRGIRLTADNFEDAASTALDYLVQRPEIDATQIGVYSISLASFWGMRFAARDRRIRAIAAPAASVAEKYFLMDLESPRWKQLFAYTTQSKSEAELDAVMGEMTLDGYMAKITCRRCWRSANTTRAGRSTRSTGCLTGDGAGRALGLRRPAPHAVDWRWRK